MGISQSRYMGPLSCWPDKEDSRPLDKQLSRGLQAKRSNDLFFDDISESTKEAVSNETYGRASRDELVQLRENLERLTSEKECLVQLLTTRRHSSEEKEQKLCEDSRLQNEANEEVQLKLDEETKLRQDAEEREHKLGEDLRLQKEATEEVQLKLDEETKLRQDAEEREHKQKEATEELAEVLRAAAEESEPVTNGVLGRALLIASGKEQLNVVFFLLSSGAFVDAKDEGGWTSLCCAALHGYTEVVNVMLSQGADVNTITSAGLTALMLSAEQGFAEVTEILLRAGADVSVKDCDGETALSRACTYGHTNVVAMLRAAGARE